jgi:hypothetical protein
MYQSKIVLKYFGHALILESDFYPVKNHSEILKHALILKGDI